MQHCQLNREIKFYDTIEAGGSWLFGEPITDIFTIIKLCITLYLIVVVFCSFTYSSSNDEYNSYWLGIYSQWILVLNTFASLLSCYVTCIIWYKYKYPPTQRINTKFASDCLPVDPFDDDDVELEFNKDQNALDINLHSDTDVVDPIDVEHQQHLEEMQLTMKRYHNLNAMQLSDVSCGILYIHNLSKMISHIGIAASCMTALSYWMMVDYSLENTNDDIDWIVTILNIQYYILIVAILLFMHLITFTQLSYFNGTIFILLFDGLFALFIIIFDLTHAQTNITFLGKRSETDTFDAELLTMIFLFMSGHVGIHLVLTFIKKIFLIQYIKFVKYVEIMHEKDAKLYDDTTYEESNIIAIDKIMDPLDFEVIMGHDFEKQMMRKCGIGIEDDPMVDSNGNIISDSEGSDVGYSSHDYKHKNGAKRWNKYEKIKKKWNAIREFKYNRVTIEKSLLCGGGTSIGGNTKNNSVKIVFGSSIHQRFNDLPAVRALTTSNPHVVMFLGNSIYVDQTPRKAGILSTDVDDYTTFRHSTSSMFNFWRMDGLKLDPSTEYQRLLKHKDFILCNPDDTLPVVLATWDEHDYGGKGYDSAYQNKYHSKSAFLSFLDRIDLKHELSSYIDTMKSKTYRGIYYHYDFHHVFEEEERSDEDDHDDGKEEDVNHVFIRFIMLDLKWHRSDGGMFGREQWYWLNQLLRNSKERKDKPDWHIFGFGTPCLVEPFNFAQNMNVKKATDHKKYELPHLMSPIPLQSDYKAWDILSKTKFLSLLHDTGIAQRSLLLSGNMNYSQVLQDADTDIYEFECSSLTHSIPSMIPSDYYMKYYYEYCLQLTDVCNVNGYGYLEIDKNGWKFCIRDAEGNVHIPLSKRLN